MDLEKSVTTLSDKEVTVTPLPPLRTDRASYPGNQRKPFQRPFRDAVSLPLAFGDGLPDGIQGVARSNYLRSPSHRGISK
jgi:hypothetical protein